MFGAGGISANVALLFPWVTSGFGCVCEVTCLLARGGIGCGNGCEDGARGTWDISRSVPLLADLVLEDLLGKVYI